MDLMLIKINGVSPGAATMYSGNGGEWTMTGTNKAPLSLLL
jgi:hypothetical protein